VDRTGASGSGLGMGSHADPVGMKEDQSCPPPPPRTGLPHAYVRPGLIDPQCRERNNGWLP
jgi:hypothetical protein